MDNAKLPLEGLKVVEFTWVAVGPTTTGYLANHGATVVRVEGHTRLDPLRVSGPFKDGIPGPDRSAWFAEHNPSKYCVSLNMDHASGRDIAWRLIKWADVMAEGFTPGTMAKWGMDYESVRKVRPDIVYFSTCTQGQYGPHSVAPGYGPMVTALAGMAHISGWPDRGPCLPFGAYSDYTSPRFGVAMIMAALEYRRRTGRGVRLDQSQYENSIQLIAPAVMDHFITGRVAGRNGNRLDYEAPHGVYRCLGDDSWCAIAVFGDMEWRAFVNVMGAPTWANDSKFSTLRGRKQHEDELDRRVEEWTVNYTPEYVMSRLQAAGVRAARVEKVSELFDDPQLKHREHFRLVEHPVVGPHRYNSPPFRMSETGYRLEPGPCLGQHNEYVLRELLGLSDEEIAEAVIQGALTTEADLPKFKSVM